MSYSNVIRNAILNGPEAAEEVKYVPYVGIARNIRVRVVRQPREETEAVGGSKDLKFTQTSFEVYAVNDPVLGVTKPQVGKDEIYVKENLYDLQPTRFTIASVLHGDTGLYRLKVMK